MADPVADKVITQDGYSNKLRCGWRCVKYYCKSKVGTSIPLISTVYQGALQELLNLLPPPNANKEDETLQPFKHE